MPNDELIAALENSEQVADYWHTDDLVAYLREYTDEGHQIAANRLEAYEHVIFAALRATERGEAGR